MSVVIPTTYLCLYEMQVPSRGAIDEVGVFVPPNPSKEVASTALPPFPLVMGLVCTS